MIEGALKSLLTSKKQAIFIMATSILLFSFYKLFKIYLKNDLDPFQEYYLYQCLLTVYRMIGFILCFYIIKKTYVTSHFIFKGIHKSWITTALIFCIFLFIIKFYFQNMTLLSVEEFLLELYFNLFTGFWEEFLFRGMLLVSLAYFLKMPSAVILSSLVFTLWHYDVSSHILEFTSIFLFSIFVSISLVSGISLVALSLFHFLYDQIIFGFIWQLKIGQSFTHYLLALCVLNLLFLGFFYIKVKNVPKMQSLFK